MACAFRVSLMVISMVIMVAVCQVAGSSCTNGLSCEGKVSACKVGGVYYCCPGAYMQLTWNYGRVTSCNCVFNGQQGYQCGGNGGDGNAAGTVAASGWTCALVIVMAAVGGRLWLAL